MATVDKVVDQAPADMAPVDPNVIVPRHVQEAARLAEAYYNTAPETEAETAAKAEAARVAAEAAQNNSPPAAENRPLEPQPQDQSLPQPTKEQLQDDTWAGRYNSMKGRWESSQRTVGSLQQQLIDLGDELGRVNALLSRAGVPTAPAAADVQPQRGHDHNKLITDADRDTYGEELLDTVTRAARGAIEPELTQLRADNEQLKKRVISDDQRVLRTQLAQAVPNWSAIQKSPEFGNWLRLPNVYTGELRGNMLRTAYGSANAQQVIALFQDFVKEVQATGGNVPSDQRQQQQHLAPARNPAMNLEELAAPGRAKPAGGDTQTPADKPIYTRADISRFYADSRKGLYAGREAEYNRTQADLTAAQREGRIRG